ncbi:uncharacterized protein LOC130569017 [Triplophysa rosa]|uniref:uncharacterized protein LOC130569017 n=1 Tax=Triplophysa rosa TaxID=992332 RepID=UPI002545F0FF|nr:uncharacterized protein LOC130569017 [Triplophysa rosa]
MAKARRPRLGKVLKDFFCMPVVIDCSCKECKPEASPEIDSSSVSSESEVFVTAQTSLVSLVEDATQDNVETAPPKKGKQRKVAKAVKNFFCMPMVIECSCEECNPKLSPELESRSFAGESEVFVTAPTSLVTPVEDATQDNVETAPPKKGKWRKVAKAVKNFFCMPMVIECSCEECNPKLSPELESRSFAGESEVFVTAQTSLVTPVEDATQDNVETAPPKKGKWRKVAKAVKNFFCMPLVIECSCEECNPKGSPELLRGN